MDERWQRILREMIAAEASDLHAAPGQCIQMRSDGVLSPLPLTPTAVFMERVLEEMLSAEQHTALCRNDVDFSYVYEGRRFRGNAYRMQGGVGLALRLLPNRIMTPEEIGMPDAMRAASEAHGGLVLVCGPTGAGKTTTLAALIEGVNRVRRAHIITLEDPIEYLFAPDLSFFSQREAGRDFTAFPDAVRSALREAPDLLLVGEIRDRATMEAALMAAETGVLVFGTLHTRSAIQTAMRVEGMFPADVRDAVRAQFAEAVAGIFSQQLLPRRGGGRVAVIEALCPTPAVRNILRQGNYSQLASLMMSGAAQGMQTREMAEAALRAKGMIA